MSRSPFFPIFGYALLFVFTALVLSGKVSAGQRISSLPKTAEEMQRLMGDGYTCLDRDELLIVSDIDRKLLYQLASRDFIVYMHVLRRDFYNKSHAAADGRRAQAILTVFLFKDRESYVRGLRKIGIDVAVEDEENRGALRDGYYYPGRKRNFILINYRDQYERGISTYAHEVSHALLRKEFSDPPAWINEGIATMAGNGKMVDNRLRYDGESSIRRVKKALEKGNLLPLARVLELTGKEFAGRENSLRFYDASEQFCLFLQSRNQLRAVYHALRDGKKGGETGARTVARVTRSDLNRLEKEWHGWLMKQ